jgi:hypothetical protein
MPCAVSHIQNCGNTELRLGFQIWGRWHRLVLVWNPFFPCHGRLSVWHANLAWTSSSDKLSPWKQHTGSPTDQLMAQSVDGTILGVRVKTFFAYKVPYFILLIFWLCFNQQTANSESRHTLYSLSAFWKHKGFRSFVVLFWSLHHTTKKCSVEHLVHHPLGS